MNDQGTTPLRPLGPTSDAPTGLTAVRHLFLLRACSLGAVLVLVLISTQAFQIALPIPQLLPGIAALACFTTYTGWLRRRRRAVSEGQLFWQLVLDLHLITYLLYFSGGHENPFAPAYFVPLALGAAYLRRTLALLVAAIMLSDLLLMHLLQFAPLVMIDGSTVPTELMKAGVDASYLLTASGLAFFVSRLASAAKEQTVALAQARERQLNDELVIGFGTLAAGAAHELANPLSSISVAASEMRGGYLPIDDGLEIIISQTQACRETLRNLADTGRRAREASSEITELDGFLGSVAARFSVLRPDASLDSDWSLPLPAPFVREDATLTQSLIALLNNAAEASPSQVKLAGTLLGETLVVEVADRGPGIPHALLDRIGRPFQSTRRPGEGMGMGLFLAKTSIERLGGMLSFSDREGGGTRVTVSLPLAAILA